MSLGVSIAVTGFGVIFALAGYGALSASDGYWLWFVLTLISLLLTGVGAIHIAEVTPW